MARTYGLTGKQAEKPLSGQAKAIFDGMTETSKDGKPEFLDGKAWTELLKDRFKTRQDAYRVVLYYLLIFKKRGLVAVQETAPTAEEASHELAGETVDAVEATGDTSEAEELETSN
jgi:hypothetical protein